MATHDQFSLLRSLVGYGFSTAMRIVRLIVLHLGCMAAALLVAATLEGVAGFFTGWLAVYAGLVCFVPLSGTEELSKRALPIAAGLLLALCWTFWGMPWQFTIFWGGFAAWLCHLALRREMGWEWLNLPLLFAGLLSYIIASKFVSVAASPLWTFPLFVLAGYFGARIYGRLRGPSIREGLLRASCKKLRAKLDSASLPESLRIGAAQLEKQSLLLLDSGSELAGDDEGLIRALANAVDLTALTGPHSGEGRIKELEARLSALNQQLYERLEGVRKARPAREKSPLELRLDGFAQSARSLQFKAAPLPEDIRSPVAGIGRSAEAIIGCMRDDPNDVAPGDRFLSRYLKAAHTVVDEYNRLSPQSGADAAMAELLSRSRDLLQRLESAFAQEHAGLLRNDAVNFTAELNVLDKLLKMDGK